MSLGIRLFESPENLYPPKGTAKAVTERVPLTVFPFSYVVEKQKLGFQKYTSTSKFLKVAKTFIVRMGGWVDGWVGCDQKSLSIFFIFEYINKQCLLLQSMDLKVAYPFR